jgi:hypothetical protein
MNALHNIEKSAIRRFEYVGYGGGAVYRVRKHGCGGWEAFARAPWMDCQYLRADTLAKLSAKLEALPQPAIDRTR